MRNRVLCNYIIRSYDSSAGLAHGPNHWGILYSAAAPNPALIAQLEAGAVLGIFIWVGQSKAKQILSRPTRVVYMGIMGMTRAVYEFG